MWLNLILVVIILLIWIIAYKRGQYSIYRILSNNKHINFKYGGGYRSLYLLSDREYSIVCSSVIGEKRHSLSSGEG